jgi:hypothetical protein
VGRRSSGVESRADDVVSRVEAHEGSEPKLIARGLLSACYLRLIIVRVRRRQPPTYLIPPNVLPGIVTTSAN